MWVEFDIFSGRPNPSWKMSFEEVVEVRSRLGPMIKTEKPPDEGGLGYRGFVISNSEKIPGIPIEIRVYKAILTVNENRSTSYYTDVNDIETLLIDQARKRGYEDLVSAIT